MESVAYPHLGPGSYTAVSTAPRSFFSSPGHVYLPIEHAILNLGAQVFARRVESGDKPTWERVLSQLKPVAT